MRVSTLLICLIFGIFGLIYYFSPLLHPLPPLAGPYNVGTKTYYWTDTNRYEKYSSAQEHRKLRVQVWYPTNALNTNNHSYMADAKPHLIEEFKQMYWYIPSFLWHRLFNVTTPTIPDAPLASADKEYPLIVFSHGFEGTSELYSTFLLELASHGYIVVGIDHPYFARIVPFPDGKAIDVNQQLLEVIMNNLNDRGKIAETISQDFKTCIPDIIFVLDQLEKINTDIDSPFFQKFDLNKLCIMGHSMGGIASLEVLRTDNRCKAGIIIDCFNTYINSVEPIEKPLLFIMGEKGILTEDDPCLKQQLNAMQTFCSSSGQCSIFVIPKAGHIAFCDLILLKWPANRLLTWWKLPIGPCDPYNTLKDINKHILTFFDQV